MIPTLAASAAVFRNGKVLLGRRTAAAAHGLWTLPGGRLEPGEALADAALRELHEETGVVAQACGPADIVEFIERDADGTVRLHFVIVAFAATWRSGEAVAGPELDAVAWVDPDTLGGHRVTDGLAEVVRKAKLLAERAAGIAGR